MSRDDLDPTSAADAEASATEEPTPDAAAPGDDAPGDDASEGGDAKGIEDAIDELDALLSGASFEDPVAGEPEPAPAAKAPQAGATKSPAAAPSATRQAATDVMALPQFEKVLQEAQVSGIDLLKDVNLDVKIELGRCRMLVEDVLKLVEGSVVELDKLAGDPVDVYVNERLVARGEVLVLNDNFCVRVNDIVETHKEDDL